MDYELQMKWEPRSLGRRKGGSPPLGLRNLGNTCYLNSVLQCLTYTPPLANFCLRFLHSSICEKQRKAERRDCPFCVLEKRIARSLNLDLANDAPSKIGSCLRLFADHFQPGRQEDAHEFLRYVIDACHDTSLNLLHPELRRRTVVKDIFGGSLLSQIRCLSCGCESSKTDEIMDLSLDLVQSKTLNDALRRFFRSEMLDGDNKYSCESCKKLSPARKQMFVLQAPNVLVIQLKRFEGINGGKINKDIAFEEVLLLSNFMCKGSQDPKPQYNLFGSIVHSGFSPESGHYYAYVKDPSGRWYCCNDSHVYPSSTQEVLSEKVYILFYLRENQGQKSVKVVLPFDDQKLPESNGKGRFEIQKTCGMLKSTGEATLHSERNVTSVLNNGKVTNPQIKLGNLKNFQKNNCSSAEEKGNLRTNNNAKSERFSGLKQLTVSENSNILSTGMGVKNSAASYSKGEFNGTSRADILSSNDQVTKGSVHPIRTEKNMKAIEGADDDPVKVKADAHNAPGTESSFEVQCPSRSKINESSSNGLNKKRKSNAHSAIASSHCSISDVFKEHASCGSYKVSVPVHSPEALQNFIERLSEKTREALQSCGWTGEVHDTMRAQKRRCIEAAGRPPDISDIRDLLVADAKKILISRIPHVLKEDLIVHLRRFFGEVNHVGGV